MSLILQNPKRRYHGYKIHHETRPPSVVKTETSVSISRRYVIQALSMSLNADFIFSFWSFEIREGIFGNQELLIGLDLFLNSFKILVSFWVILVFASTV